VPTELQHLNDYIKCIKSDEAVDACAGLRQPDLVEIASFLPEGVLDNLKKRVKSCVQLSSNNTIKLKMHQLMKNRKSLENCFNEWSKSNDKQALDLIWTLGTSCTVISFVELIIQCC
jgi:hypothetical protein